MEIAFGYWLAEWPFSPKDTGRLLRHDEPWPADVTPDGEWRINEWAEFAAARTAYKSLARRLALIRYEPLTEDGNGMRIRYVLRR